MDDRKKKLEEIRISKKADKLMLQGGTDSESAVAIISNNGNATRQLYSGIGQETLQSAYDFADSGEETELSKESIPYHDNLS